MTEQQFCYWLQGFSELNGDCPPTREQWKAIREHLATVFTKVTPTTSLGKMALEFAKELEDVRAPIKPVEWPTVPPYTLQTTIC